MYRLAQMERSGVSTARMRCLDGQAIRLRLSRMEVSNRFRWEIAAEAILSGRERTEEEFRELYVAAGFRLSRIIPVDGFQGRPSMKRRQRSKRALASSRKNQSITVA